MVRRETGGRDSGVVALDGMVDPAAEKGWTFSPRGVMVENSGLISFPSPLVGVTARDCKEYGSQTDDPNSRDASMTKIIHR